MDIGLYRSYVEEYGRPNLFPDFDYWASSGARDFNGLNSESILKGYGYSVGRAGGLRIGQRQELLAEIVDLEILTVKQVVGLLGFFVRTHTDDKFAQARYEWKADIKFIQEYKVDPKRFLIAKT